MLSQDLEGKKAKILGVNDLHPTESSFGVDDRMYDFVGKVFKISRVLKERDYYYDEKTDDEVAGVEYVVGIEMFGYQWDMEDVELIPIEIKPTKKTFLFNPKLLIEETKEHANKPKRISNSTDSKRSIKAKSKSKRNTSKATSGHSTKRNIKI